MTIREAIDLIVSHGRSLSEDEAAAVMRDIMSEATPAQIGDFLVALRLKGETVDEITGMARVMRKHALAVPFDEPGLVDTCGTGGDASGTFNVSTAAACSSVSDTPPISRPMASRMVSTGWVMVLPPLSAY